jgi:hypothetical protein
MADVVWSTPAMGMVPSSRTVREDKYVTTAGRVKFDVGKSGRITFVASLTTPFPQDTYHLLAHVERPGPDLAGARITLRRARRADGAVDTVLTCDSVQSGPTTNNVRFARSPDRELAIDLNTYYYWVQVDDETSVPATAQTVRATLGVSLVRS